MDPGFKEPRKLLKRKFPWGQSLSQRFVQNGTRPKQESKLKKDVLRTYPNRNCIHWRNVGGDIKGGGGSGILSSPFKADWGTGKENQKKGNSEENRGAD